MRELFLVLFAAVVVFGGSITPALRTAREIQEYREYLESTIDGDYEEPDTPELAELQNTEERSGKFEGDIILDQEQIDQMVEEFATGVRNGQIDTRRHWPGAVVYYNITKNVYTSAQIAAIETGLKAIEKVSCIRFKSPSSSTKNFITVVHEKSGCSSKVGMSGGKQTLNLTPSSVGSSCFKPGTIIHEFLHAIGFHHMHSTYNRDEYVKIVWAKIKPGKEKNFNMRSSSEVSLFGERYDYGSVMHYTEYGSSIDGSKTIVALKETSQTIGQRIAMSNKDIRKLNTMYKCP